MEKRIKDLEDKEKELINALRDTNQLELLAMEDLKKVLNGDQVNALFESSSVLSHSIRLKK